jgi:hypothetical protein
VPPEDHGTVPAAAVDALVLGASVLEIVVAFTVAALLCGVWVVANFLLVLDDIPILSKVVWFLALTLLLPIAVPLYLFLRHRRHATTRAAAEG